MVKKQCQQCGKDFNTYPAWVRKGGGKFCNIRCKGKWMSEHNWGEAHPQYKASAHSRLCFMCKKEFRPHNTRSKYCSYLCKGRYVRGENHGRYIPDTKYSATHNWVRYHFGSANLCENFYCPKTSNVYEWSLLRGKEMTKQRENYWKLCKRCHLIYDRKDYPVSKEPL